MRLRQAGTAMDSLDDALAEGFRDYLPYSRARSLMDVLTKVRANCEDCPLSDQKLNARIRSYAIRHGFNVVEGL